VTTDSRCGMCLQPIYTPARICGGAGRSCAGDWPAWTRHPGAATTANLAKDTVFVRSDDVRVYSAVARDLDLRSAASWRAVLHRSRCS
jgi:hypothetical protein